MQNYVTRQEFEELKEMLLCRGDNQTVAVDHTPGGQLIRSISVTTPEAEVASDYITVTYDSVTEKFTLDISDMPFIALPSSVSGTYVTFPETGRATESTSFFNKTFVYNKPASGTNKISVFIIPTMDVDDVDDNYGLTAYWSASNDNAVGSDQTTLDREILDADNSGMSQVCYFILFSDGTYDLRRAVSPSTPPAVLGCVGLYPRLVAESDLNRLSIGLGLGNMPLSPSTFPYTPPFESNIYITFTNGNNFLEISDSFAGDGYVFAGRIKVDSAGVVRRCQTSLDIAVSKTVSLGFTGTIDPTENTLTSAGTVYNKS